MGCFDLVEMVSRVVVELDQHTIVLVHDGIEQVILVHDIVVTVVANYPHSDKIVSIIGRVYDSSAVWMVSYVGEVHAGITDSANLESGLVLPNIGEKTGVAENTYVRVIVEAVIVETIGTRSLVA